MLKKLLVISAFILTTNLYSQWYWQNPLPQKSDLLDVEAIDTNTVIAVGKSGAIMKTTDSGETWHTRNSGTNMELSKVQFVNRLIGFVLGSQGLLLKTNDGGDTWLEKSINTSAKIYSFYFKDESTGWVCGHYGQLMRTTDGGNTWEKQNSKTINTLYHIIFVNDSLGFAVGEGGAIIKTTDRGNSWKGYTIGELHTLKYFFALDDSTYWLMGKNVLFKTTDKGNNWEIQLGGLGYEYENFKSCWFFNKDKGFVFSNSDLLTEDGGRTWKEISWSGNRFNAVDFIGRSGWGVRESGIIKRTYDEGKRWYGVVGLEQNFFYDIYFLNEKNGWACSDNKYIYRTTNGGYTWAKINIPAYVGKTLHFADERIGYVFAYNDLYKTTDDGNTWENVFTSVKLFYDACFIDKTIWIVGGQITGSNVLAKSTDGGITWEEIIMNIRGKLYSLFFFDDDTGWAYGSNGKIIKSTDGGRSWKELISGTTEELQSGFFINKSKGWICGYGGTILFTSDGGETWNIQHKEELVFLQSILFVNENKGWAVGYNGIILSTTNGGLNWSRQYAPTEESLHTLFFLDENIGWVAGHHTTILKTTNGGITFVEEEHDQLPINFVLYQNYPNPFNPSTTIEYTIPTPPLAPPLSKGRDMGGVVTLKVYDLLGREITTLVNEYQPPGKYSVEFSTNNLQLSSGVYFYTLRVMDSLLNSRHLETKKMILLK
ncbi:MAG: YCF48-related protein [Bacteroidota bacterium]